MLLESFNNYITSKLESRLNDFLKIYIESDYRVVYTTTHTIDFPTISKYMVVEIVKEANSDRNLDYKGAFRVLNRFLENTIKEYYLYDYFTPGTSENLINSYGAKTNDISVDDIQTGQFDRFWVVFLYEKKKMEFSDYVACFDQTEDSFFNKKEDGEYEACFTDVGLGNMFCEPAVIRFYEGKSIYGDVLFDFKSFAKSIVGGEIVKLLNPNLDDNDYSHNRLLNKIYDKYSSEISDITSQLETKIKEEIKEKLDSIVSLTSKDAKKRYPLRVKRVNGKEVFTMRCDFEDIFNYIKKRKYSFKKLDGITYGDVLSDNMQKDSSITTFQTTIRISYIAEELVKNYSFGKE